MLHVNSNILWKDKEKCETENVVQEPVRLSWAPPQDVPVWDISNCFLQDGQILIPREEEVMDNRHIQQCQQMRYYTSRYWMYCMPLNWLWCVSPVCLKMLFDFRCQLLSFDFISANDEGTEPGQQLSLQRQSPEHQWKSHGSVSVTLKSNLKIS